MLLCIKHAINRTITIIIVYRMTVAVVSVKEPVLYMTRLLGVDFIVFKIWI